MKSSIIPPDKSFNFRISELKKEYVRTGVMADGSCFFHCYLKAFNFKYKTMAPSERSRTVQQLRQKLADNFDINAFKDLSSGEHRKMLFFGALRQILKRTTAALPVEKLISVLEVATTYSNSFYNKFIEEALKQDELKGAPWAARQAFVDSMKEAFREANILSLNHFKFQLLNEEIGSTEIEYIAKYLKCNFIFIYETENGIEKYPFSTIVNGEWPFCVLLWVRESHYEVIGRKEENSVITRIFYGDDEIITHFSPEDSEAGSDGESLFDPSEK